MTTARDAYARLIDHARRVALLGSTRSLLAWDQEAMMPVRGLDHRAQQLALIAELRHGMATDPRVADWLAACEDDPSQTADPHSVEATNLRELRRAYDRQTTLPPALVREWAEATATAKAAWADARRHSDFRRFRPHLARLLDLARQKAACLGWDRANGGEAWDALADDYERGLTAAQVKALFDPLAPRLTALVQAADADPRPASKKVSGTFSADPWTPALRATLRDLAAAIGFDFDRGRLDTSTHPFCSGAVPTDVRMTTRLQGESLADLLDTVSTVLHESGHGMYAQGLPIEHAGTPAGSAIGLGIHESQSRLWENHVGRSAGFWRWAGPRVRASGFAAAADASDADLHAAANRVRPGLIRVEADELTYDLHILIRFELERALLRDELDAADLPDAWNAAYRDRLGVDVSDDAHGCLQDIHWSQGAIGYFPTYTLGNLYAAQLHGTAVRDLAGGDRAALEAEFAAGRFDAFRGWLREHVHRHGMRYGTADLIERVTGEPPSPEPLLAHLERKLERH